MPRIRKYRPGAFLGPPQAIDEILAGNYLFMSGCLAHPSWAGCWQISWVRQMADALAIRRAVVTDEWRAAHTSDEEPTP